MSDILIKNMEMPTSCGECELCVCYVREDGTKENYRCPITLYIIHNFNERHKHCPLIEVPSPHGRLIDADALKEQWLNAERTTGAEKVLNLPLECFISYGCVYDLDNAPTIIEAEGE